MECRPPCEVRELRSFLSAVNSDLKLCSSMSMHGKEDQTASPYMCIRVESLVVWCAGAGTTADTERKRKCRSELPSRYRQRDACSGDSHLLPRRDEGSRERSVGAMMQHTCCHIPGTYLVYIAPGTCMYVVLGAVLGELAPDAGWSLRVCLMISRGGSETV